MRIVYAGLLQCGNDAIEFRHTGHGTDAHPVHSAAGNEVIPYENLAVAAAA